MMYVAIALAFFGAAVAIHLLVCRHAKQEGLFLRQFFLIAGANLIVCWMVFFFLSRMSVPPADFWQTPLPVSATFFYILLIPTYLVFYFSTQQMSPSKKIMMLLCQKDLTFEELDSHFRDEELVEPRIRDLVLTKCIAENNGRYVLTPSGGQLAVIYAAYQALLGRKKGG